MDNEGGKRQETESSDNSSDGGDIPEPFGIRHFIQDGIRFDRVLLAYNWVFLPGLSLILWSIFLVVR